MDKVFYPLVSDFSRWKIGFKVNYGLSVGHVFICGGTSNIKNIANYLTEKWDTKVVLLESFDRIDADKIDVNPKNKSKFTLVNMMATGMKRKNRFINLLTKNFAQTSTAEFPLHSISFIGVRVLMASVVLFVSLLVERFFIQRDIKFVNSKLASVVKNDELSISGRQRRALVSTPKPVYDALVKRQRGVRQEISTLQSALEIQALSPLVVISQLAASTQATLNEFKSNDEGEIKCIFTSETLDELNNLKASLERASFQDIVVEIDQKKLQLTMTALGN
jgi:hypothetical protein